MQSTERKHFFFSQIILLKYLQAVCVRTWLNPSPALSLEFLNKKSLTSTVNSPSVS